MHHYVCVYFNYIGYNTRFKLTTEFLERYPNVHCIEVAYGDRPFEINHPNTTQHRFEHFGGFPVYKVLNQYIKANLETLESITLLDSDLILPEGFFSHLEVKLDSHSHHPAFIQPFELAIDNYPTPAVIYVPRLGAAAGRGVEGCHTGYLYTFNRKLVDKLGHKLFPEVMVFGGFDHLFYLCLFGDKEKVKNTIPNQQVTEEWIDFMGRIKGCSYDYMNGVIHHEYHGDKMNRYQNRWKRYKDCSLDNLTSYFRGRLEDEKVIN